MELTIDNFAETLKAMEEKYLPSAEVILTPQGIVWNENIENFDKMCGTGGLFRYTHSTGKHTGFLQSDISRINELIKDIPRFFQKHSRLGKKYWNTSSSYGSKHFLSDELRKETPQQNTYCNNGQFILAMWILDYEMKPIKIEYEYFHFVDNGKTKSYLNEICLNVIFNCSHRDLSKVICPCGLQYTKSAKRQHERSRTHQMIMEAQHINDTPTEFDDFLEEQIERLI